MWRTMFVAIISLLACICLVMGTTGNLVDFSVPENKNILLSVILFLVSAYSLVIVLNVGKKNKMLEKQMEDEKKINALKIQLETVLQGNSGGFCVWEIIDRQVKYRYVSDSLMALLGYEAEEFYDKSGDSIVEMVDLSSLSDEDKRMITSLQHNEPYSLNYNIRCKDGSRKWIADYGKMLVDAKGVRKYYSYYQDVTKFVENQLKLHEIANSLRRERAQYHDALVHDSICSYDFDVTDGYIREPFFCAGHDVMADLGFSLPVKYDDYMKLMQEEHQPRVLYGTVEGQYTAAYIEAFREGRYHLEFEYYVPQIKRYERKIVFLSQNEENGHVIACTVVKDMTSIRKAEEDERLALFQLKEAAEQVAQGNLDIEIDCQVDGDVGVLADSLRKTVIELRKRIDYINNLAYLDMLTDTKNKTAYTREVDKLELVLATDEDTAFGVVMIDINNLKEVNDEQGHEMGDLLINVAASYIKDAFAPSQVYRIGGDEFVIFAYDSEIAKMAEHAEELESRLASYNRLTTNHFLYGVSVAIGYTEYQAENDMSYIDVFNRADSLMYEDKKQKKQNLQKKDISE